MAKKRKPYIPQKPRSLKERILYAVLFEVTGITLSTPILAFSSGHQMQEAGVIIVVMAAIALIWNVIFNYLFDAWLQKYQISKTTPVRIWHSVCFEAGLLAISIPFVMWYLEVGFVEAVMLDLLISLFYLVFTYIFTLIWDTLRGRYWGKLSPEELEQYRHAQQIHHT
ncbi:PACE efflux transporter [Brackiella oedipodis]|uniref:PACE efflux transporter n=1 Tax=Brackiella oedipodis TaxID=124225 RepID=UPI0006884747|nr:PACE efflux transporter [Brackiella oedipodis]